MYADFLLGRMGGKPWLDLDLRRSSRDNQFDSNKGTEASLF